MAPNVLSTSIFEILFTLSRSMYLSRHVIVETFIIDLLYYHLLPCFRHLLLLLLSFRCSKRFIFCLNTESIVFWPLFLSSRGYLLLSHILIVLWVILIVYQVIRHKLLFSSVLINNETIYVVEQSINKVPIICDI